MPQLENKEILEKILRSTIGVIARRTSEGYANVIIGKCVRELSEKFFFLKFVHIQGTQFQEVFEIVNIDSEIEAINPKDIGKSIVSIIQKITRDMGKNTGYFFIKEIKDDLPFSFEPVLKEIDVDLDLLQLKFVTEIKGSYIYQVENSEVLKSTFELIFEILNSSFGMDLAYTLLSENVSRLNTQYEVLSYVKINDIRAIYDIEVVTVDDSVNSVDGKNVGAAIQKCIQDINIYLTEKKNFLLIDRLKNKLNSNILFKLGSIGVNLDVIQIKQALIVKHVLRALIGILSDATTDSYAFVVINNILKKYEKEFGFLSCIKVDSVNYSKGLESIIVSSEIETIRESDLGKSLQKIIEDIAKALGEKAGSYFVEKLKKKLGKAYILRIEELGVNLHMIELKQNLIW